MILQSVVLVSMVRIHLFLPTVGENELSELFEDLFLVFLLPAAMGNGSEILLQPYLDTIYEMCVEPSLHQLLSEVHFSKELFIFKMCLVVSVSGW